jgi:hypothetical protein
MPNYKKLISNFVAAKAAHTAAWKKFHIEHGPSGVSSDAVIKAAEKYAADPAVAAANKAYVDAHSAINRYLEAEAARAVKEMELVLTTNGVDAATAAELAYAAFESMY